MNELMGVCREPSQKSHTHRTRFHLTHRTCLATDAPSSWSHSPPAVSHAHFPERLLVPGTLRGAGLHLTSSYKWKFKPPASFGKRPA